MKRGPSAVCLSRWASNRQGVPASQSRYSLAVVAYFRVSGSLYRV